MKEIELLLLFGQEITERERERGEPLRGKLLRLEK